MSGLTVVVLLWNRGLGIWNQGIWNQEFGLTCLSADRFMGLLDSTDFLQISHLPEKYLMEYLGY
jgi:hypothetical protein